MLESSKLSILFTEAVAYANEALITGKAALIAVKSSPEVIAAQPAIALVGSVLGVISGYEIGRTIVLKARGHWHPSLVRPVVILVGVLALAILASPPVAIAMASFTAAGAIFGVIKGALEKAAPGKLNFEQYQQAYGNKPDDVDFVSPQQFAQIDNPTKKHVCGLMWNLTKEACDMGEAFTEGMFVIESKSVREIYEKISSIDESYSRKSSHFTGRNSTDKKNLHRGLDFGSGSDALPGNKRTILFGLADTHDDNVVLFIKPENWGADHHITSPEKLKHYVSHAFQFIHAQYVKIMRPGYDDRPGTAKERIPHDWKDATTKFGWAKMSTDQQDKLIENESVPESWMIDDYRTGREVYVYA